jgi:hypothetical protein
VIADGNVIDRTFDRTPTDQVIDDHPVPLDKRYFQGKPVVPRPVDPSPGIPSVENLPDGTPSVENVSPSVSLHGGVSQNDE